MPIELAMLYSRVRWEEKAIIREAEKRSDLKLKPINVLKIFFELDSLKNLDSFDVFLQRCVSYFQGLHSTAILEEHGFKVVNSLETTLVCGNKLFTTLRLLKHRVPTPKTIVAFDVSTALEALKVLSYPSMVKPVYGSWGRLVAPLKDPQSAKAILESRTVMHPLYQIFYLQEYVKRPPRDIRSFVVGDSVPVAIYRVSSGDEWRTNTSLGGKAVQCEVTPEIEELSLKAAEAVGGGVLGVDIMEDEEKGLLVHEVNHVVEFRNTVPLTGVNLPKLILDYAIEVAKK